MCRACCGSTRPAELNRQSLAHHVRVLLLAQVSLICPVLLGSTSIHPCKHISELVCTAEAVRVRLLEHYRSAVAIVGLLGLIAFL